MSSAILTASPSVFPTTGTPFYHGNEPISNVRKASMRSSDVSIRPLESRFAKQIIRIAAACEGFTVPTEYLIWMLAATQGPICQVALNRDEKILAYILAIRTIDPHSIFLWQVGVNKDSVLFAMLAAQELCKSATKVALDLGMARVFFTAVPSRSLKLARMLAHAVRPGARVEPTYLAPGPNDPELVYSISLIDEGSSTCHSPEEIALSPSTKEIWSSLACSQSHASL